MIKKNYYKKIFVGAAALFILLAPVGVNISKLHTSLGFNIASAQLGGPIGIPGVGTPTTQAYPPSTTQQNSSPSWFSCTGNIATCAVYFVALTVDNVMTLGVALGAFLIREGLQFNDNIYNSPAVLTGFSVTLALANLGFVLGIIIIAIATILRNQTYGMKQLLWKLVVMAILVNFGLVITAPIVGFASSLSNYFINATSPPTSSGVGELGGNTGYEGYVTTIAQAFAPQSITQNSISTSTAASACSGGTTGTNAICNLQASENKNVAPADSFTQTVLALFFGIAFLSLTTFTFFCIAILLIVRYLMLAGLLIVLPLAWLTFIFPKFDGSFSKWWNVFVKWTLFPPLALFFIYLAFITATNTGTSAGGTSTTGTTNSSAAYLTAAAGLPANANTGPEGAIVYQTGLGGPIQQAADEILLIGLTVMGLMFANSLSGKAGSTVVNGATHASTAVAGYAGRRAKKVGRYGYQKMDKAVQNASGKGITQRLQEGKIPGLNLVPFGRRAASLAGRGISKIATNEELVKESQKNAPKNWEEAKHNLAGDMNIQDQFAHIAVGVKEGKIKRGDMVKGKKVDDYLDNEDLVHRYGQEKLVADADKIFMGNKITRAAEKAMEAAAEKAKKEGKSDNDQVAAMETATVTVEKDIKDEDEKVVIAKGRTENAAVVYEAAKKEWLNKTSKVDAGKGDANTQFGPAATKGAAAMAMLEKNLMQIAKYAPQIVPNLVKGMKSPTIKIFSEQYNKTLDQLVDQYRAEGNKEQLARYVKYKNTFDKTITNSIFGSAESEKNSDKKEGDEGGGNDKH